jgi:ubiquinone/menaquinone biosynthesis C-methylase UbiE
MPGPSPPEDEARGPATRSLSLHPLAKDPPIREKSAPFSAGVVVATPDDERRVAVISNSAPAPSTREAAMKMADTGGEMTERLLVEAGIGAGKRVLDVGCGRGDVSFLVARLVGEQGQVLGVDRDSGALAVARERARELDLPRVTFAESDLSAISPVYGEFDGIVGRRVLMYQPDPVDAIRRLAGALRPGGVIVFQEHDALIGPTSRMPLPLHERVHGWTWRTVEREGASTHMGFDLASVFEQAGLLVEQVRAEAIVQTPRAHRAVGPILRAMLSRIVQQGVATEEELGIETIDERLVEERRKANATYIGDMVFGAWARKPG